VGWMVVGEFTPALRDGGGVAGICSPGFTLSITHNSD
jgi:hypothetical protein